MNNLEGSAANVRNEARLLELLDRLGMSGRDFSVNEAFPHDRYRRSVEIPPPPPSSTSNRESFGIAVDHERWYAALISSDLGVWDWNMVDSFCYMSDQYIKMLVYKPEDWTSNVVEWTDRLHPDDVDHTTRAMQAHLDGYADFYAADIRLLTSAGTYKWVHTRGRMVEWDERGQPTRMIGTHTDIDQQKRAVEQLQQQAVLVDKAHDAIFVVDLSWIVTTWNKSSERLFGWDRNRAIGAKLDAVLAADQQKLREGFEHTLVAGEWTGELEFSRLGGEDAVGDCRLTLVADSQGEPSAIMAIITDITERKEIERQFFRAQRMESIGTMAGGIAHDLNNVLAPTLLYSDMLKQDLADDPAKLDQVAGIATSAQRAADLVSQLLNFAKGTQGNQLVLRLDRLILETVKIASETFDPGIEIRTEIADEVCVVEGDPTQLHQVLLNLCVNARDAMPDGGTLTIKAREELVSGAHPARAPKAKQGLFPLIEVIDSGVGIEPDVLPRIFDPFFTQKPSGTGIGLSSAQTIVHSHGGFIDVLSEPGQGSQFQVYLPASAKAGSEVIDLLGATEFRGDGHLVLVVDDEPIVRHVLAQMLTECEYEVLLASGGDEALELFNQHDEDIKTVLTDMKMPGMNGTTLLRTLRATNPNVRLVATSGVNTAGLAQEALAAGATEFVAKPYTTLDLLRALSNSRESAHK